MESNNLKVKVMENILYKKKNKSKDTEIEMESQSQGLKKMIVIKIDE